MDNKHQTPIEFSDYVIKNIKSAKNKHGHLLSVISLLSLTACGGGTSPEPSISQPPPPPPLPDFTESPANTFTARDNNNRTLNEGSSTSDLSVNGKDGNDTITTGLGDDVIDGGAGGDTIISGDGNDIVRGNLGSDSIDAGAGDDIVIVVGTTTAGEYAETSITNPADSGLDVSSVLSLAALNDHATSDVVAGEAINGGTGNDTLLIYGTVDLTGIVIENIQTVYVNSDVTFDIAHLLINGGSIEIIQGDGGSVIRMASTGPDPVSVNFSDLNITGISQLEIGENITVVVDATADLLNAGINVISGSGSLQHTSIVIDQTGLVLVDTLAVKDSNGDAASGTFGAIVTAEGDYTADGEVNDAPTDFTFNGDTAAENISGLSIGAIAVEDPDEAGTNWNSYSYAISDDRFEIVSGQLKLKEGESLNYEVENTIDVTVTATGSGAAAYEISQTFSITVTDANDPITAVLLDGGVIPQSIYGTRGSYIGHLSVQDEDTTDIYSYRVISIASWPDAPEAITIGDDGEIWISANYNLSVPTTFDVEITSAGGDVFVETFSVVLGPDNSIISYMGRGAREHDNTDAPLLAFDLDFYNDFTGITYEITGGADGALFEMNGSEIYFTSGVALDYETQDTFFVEVMATQGGLEEKRLMQVNIDDDNDLVALIAAETPLTVAFGVNGAIVGLVPIDDPDTNPIYQNYIFQIDDSRFEVDANGAIVLKDGIVLTEAVGDEIAITVTLNEQNIASVPLIHQYTITVVSSENNNLIATTGDDVFVFDNDWGNDTITGFQDGADMIDFSGSTLAFTDLTISQNGADTLIEDVSGNSLTLYGISSTDITVDDFII